MRLKDLKGKLEFQYNDCLGSSKRSRKGGFGFLVFQYNDCLGSSTEEELKYANYGSFNTTIVWVRLAVM